MLNSIIHERGPVPFPVFTGERHYMIPFYKETGLPAALGHWQPTVDAMLDGIDTDQPIYFMADQSVVQPGLSHRRPGVHIDGYWRPDIHAYSGGGGNWSHVDLSAPEALILSSDVAGARAYAGHYEEKLIGEGGEASRVPLESLSTVNLKPHQAYVGTVGMLHESIPIIAGGPRTVVRLNCPGVTVQ